MFKTFSLICFIFMFNVATMAQSVIPLFKGPIPGAKVSSASFKEITESKSDGIVLVKNVSVPTLTIFLPPKEKATGTAVIICPGGGYGFVAIGHEGYKAAEAFNKIGVAAFVLKYRLPDDEIMLNKGIGPLQDVQQAMYVVRKNAEKWNLKSNQIGVMGFSAGGHLASSLSVHYNDIKIVDQDLSLRPDFSILIYPVISFVDMPHRGSSKNLLGPNQAQDLLNYFSSEKNVTENTPPAFLVHAVDDKVVAVQNSIAYTQALIKNKIKAEVHLYQSGGHGFGLINKTTTDNWFERLESWLLMNKLLL